MSYLILKHLTSQQLPAEWVKQLPAGQTFTVSISPESAKDQSQVFGAVREHRGFYAHRYQLNNNFFDPS